MSDASPAEDEPTFLHTTGADPLASIRRFDVAVEIRGVEYTVRWRSAADWLDVLFAEHITWTRIIPEMLSADEADDLETRLLDPVDGEPDVLDTDLRTAAWDVITAASGRSWWFTLRLCAVIRSAWDRVGGRMAGFDAEKLTLGAWLDAAWDVIVERSDPKRLPEFISQLSMPPEGVTIVLDAEEEEEAFFAAMNSL